MEVTSLIFESFVICTLKEVGIKAFCKYAKYSERAKTVRLCAVSAVREARDAPATTLERAAFALPAAPTLSVLTARVTVSRDTDCLKSDVSLKGI